MILVYLFIMLLLAGIAYLGFRLFQLQREYAELEGDLRKQREYSKKLKGEVELLGKYRGVADADAEAAKIRKHTEDELQTAQQDAGVIVVKATQKAHALVTEAKRQAQDIQDRASAQMTASSIQAGRIVDDAKKRAEEIAGEAYDAVKNMHLYENAAKAMKNVVEGYGDRYLVPPHSLLDDLAEDFGHTEAGQQLKAARECTRSMTQNGTAGACDYVEGNRRETAINFVVDAFNGKVDSILSRVKEDNAGILEQQIRDAFTLVNLNGKAFRDAHVADEYLAARLEELKWAAVAQQLKVEEREEQRRIKEQMREEAKARREYERAIREAAKEEETLRKAMEKAQAQIAQATEEQKAKYEQQLADLQQKLTEAEDRNQRAISMAQQTKKGHVYIISNIGSFGEDVFKIGLTRRLEPQDRVRELGDSSVPFEFDVHAMILSDDAPALENRLHKHFVLMQVNKANHRKEFFRADLKEIREEVEGLGLETKWTMTAEAREYRETLAIERAIKDDPTAREAWLNRQLQYEPANCLSNENDEDA